MRAIRSSDLIGGRPDKDVGFRKFLWETLRRIVCISGDIQQNVPKVLCILGNGRFAIACFKTTARHLKTLGLFCRYSVNSR